MSAATKLIAKILDSPLTALYLAFIAVGAEQVIAGKLEYADFLRSTPMAIATAALILARAGLAASRK